MLSEWAGVDADPADGRIDAGKRCEFSCQLFHASGEKTSPLVGFRNGHRVDSPDGLGPGMRLGRRCISRSGSSLASPLRAALW